MAAQVSLRAALGYLQAPASSPLPYSPTISPLAIPRRTPARPRLASPHCAPTSPRAAPWGAPSYASAPRLALCGSPLVARLPSACGLWPPQRSHPAHPTAALPGPASHRTAGRDAWPAQALWAHGSSPPRRPTPSSGRLGKNTLRAGSRRVQSGPSGRCLDRRPRSHAPALSHMARHPRGRHKPRGPGGVPRAARSPLPVQQPVAHPVLTTHKGTGTQGYRPYIPPHQPTLLHLRTRSTPPPL